MLTVGKGPCSLTVFEMPLSYLSQAFSFTVIEADGKQTTKSKPTKYKNQKANQNSQWLFDQV